MFEEWSATLTLTEESSKELFRVLKEQDEAFINDVLDGKCSFTLESADGRRVELVPKADRKTEPQYDIDKGTIKCDNCSENGSYKCSKCDGEIYFKRLEIEDEPQKWETPPKFEHKGIITTCVGVPVFLIKDALVEDESQTERGE